MRPEIPAGANLVFALPSTFTGRSQGWPLQSRTRATANRYKKPVIEEQVDKIFLAAEGEPILVSDEAESVAQFKDEITHPL